MPQGKGTYGSKVGRPPKKKKARPTPKPNRKGVGATRKPMKPAKPAKRRKPMKPVKVAAKGKKNKNIVDTKLKNIPRALVKKTKQKIKNVANSSPKQLAKKAAKMYVRGTAPVRAYRNVKRMVNLGNKGLKKMSKKLSKRTGR